MKATSNITSGEIATMSQYCQSMSVPARPHRISYSFVTRGNSFVVLEARPAFLNKDKMLSSPIAKFAKDKRTLQWELLWRDRNQKWHHFSPRKLAKRVSTLIAEVERDPTGIFWG
jgi:hypothetical protein